ncbi:MAG: FKBP-type peptidyl-prolyl cis-trans isomerase [Burkholderiaceae bacterium]|jgi:FKBP-type peptidyl-prolyl cis-trans isomerase SlpA|nr:FKBP-type peptidyl-prolyl cis-trans isomerase [Burkholderiaceae bacterium]
MALIGPGSHITLHYRLAVVSAGEEREVVSTLALKPATLQIGAGQLSPSLEQCLIGLDEGAAATFELSADEAYGQRNPDLVQAVARGVFDANADPDTQYVHGDVVEFRSPAGDRFSGVLKSMDSVRAVVDFNHPLAGLPLRFTVQVIGVL